MSMYTTQQALEIAITIIEADQSLTSASRCEIIHKHKILSKKAWRQSWNKNTIREAIHRFVEEHGRLPNTSDLRGDNMPSEPTIRAYFHMTLTTLLVHEFPEYRFYKISPKANRYDMLTKDEWLKYFAEQFNKLNGMPLNRAIYDESDGKKGEMIDIIAGQFFLANAPYESEKFKSLTPEMIDKYNKRFRYPESFMKLGGQIMVIPEKPTARGHER